MSPQLDCEQILLVQADWDGELDAAHSAAVHIHRTQCESCTRAYETLRLTGAAMRKLPRYEAPQRTLNKVLPVARSRRSLQPWISGFAIGAAASVAAVMLLRPVDSQTAQMLVDSHVRASQSTSHLLDVVSTNHHVVKPWFDGRLPFSPPVKDLTGEGFPLLGARIDVIEGRSVGVLVYQAGRHQVDVFVWPASDSTRSITDPHERGFNLIQWNSQDAVLTAVSDLNERELQTFVERWRAAP